MGGRCLYGMDTDNTTIKQADSCCCSKEGLCCRRHHCCKLALGLVHTALMATLTAAVTLMCIHKCSHHK